MFLWLVGSLWHLSSRFLRFLLEEEEVRLKFPGTLADLQARATYLRGRRERVAPFTFASWNLKVDEHSGRLALRVSRYLLGILPYQNQYMFRGVITGQDADKGTLLAEGELRWKPFLRGFLFFWFLFVVAWTFLTSIALLLWGVGILFADDIRGFRFVLFVPVGLLLLAAGVVNARLMVILDRGGKRLLLTKLGDLGFRLR